MIDSTSIANSVYNDLKVYVDSKYRQFNCKITNSPTPMIGVRVPQLREYAKQALKTYGLEALLTLSNDKYVEFQFVKGLAVAYSKTDINTKCTQLKMLSLYWDNWAVCDSTAATIKLKKDEQEHYFDFLCNLAIQKQVFTSRFGLVSMLDHFATIDYFDRIIAVINNLPHNDIYYVDMALAWLIAEFLIKLYDKTVGFLTSSTCNLSKFVFNKSIQKACESFRVTAEQKLYLKSIKK